MQDHAQIWRNGATQCPAQTAVEDNTQIDQEVADEGDIPSGHHGAEVFGLGTAQRWPPQAGWVKVIDFSKTALLSCSQRADHGTLRGSASFALVHEKVWSKVNWLFVQVNLYTHRGLAGFRRDHVGFPTYSRDTPPQQVQDMRKHVGSRGGNARARFHDR